MAKRVSVINFKGGVGKTTLAFNLAAGLARYHDARVLVVDVDHQSSLSIVCMGTDAWGDAAESGNTVDNVFRDFLGGTMPGEEIVSATNFGRRRSYRNVAIVPSCLELDDTEIELTASNQGNAIQSEWNKRTLLCKWIEDTSVDDEYDYIIFDCAPATKIVSQNAIAASHGYLVPVVPEAVMARGAPHLHNMVRAGIDGRLRALSAMGEHRSAFVPETELIGLAVTRIQTSRGASGYTDDHTQHLRSLNRQWGDRLLRPYIVQGTGVPASLTSRVPVFDRATTQNIGGRGIHVQYRGLVREIKDRIDAI